MCFSDFKFFIYLFADTQAPNITCPKDLVFETDKGLHFATVDLELPTVTGKYLHLRHINFVHLLIVSLHRQFGLHSFRCHDPGLFQEDKVEDRKDGFQTWRDRFEWKHRKMLLQHNRCW